MSVIGDVRYEHALDRVRDAKREGALDRVSVETGIQALGTLAASRDPVLANVLTTRLLNEARRSTTLLRFVAEGVVALDAEGRVTFANPAAEELLGLDPGDLKGSDFHERVGHGKRGAGPIERHACDLLAALDAGFDAPIRVNDDDVFHRADGTPFLVGFTAAPIQEEGEATGVAVVFRDITRGKAYESDLKLFRVALDAVAIPVFWLAEDARVIYVNGAAAAHLGYSREDLTRMSVFDFDVEFSPSRWREHWARVRREGTVEFDSRHRTRAGALARVGIRVTLVVQDGREFHVAVLDRVEPDA